MTTDKLTNALIAILEVAKPDASIAVVDARGMSDIDLPCIVVDVADAQRHSLAMPGVMRCQIEVTLRDHYGDGNTRATLKTWADAIEQALNGTSVVRDAITLSGLGIRCDYFQMDGGVTRWEETTFEATFSCEALVTRTS